MLLFPRNRAQNNATFYAVYWAMPQYDETRDRPIKIIHYNLCNVALCASVIFILIFLPACRRVACGSSGAVTHYPTHG